jgi:hypothetical protein
MSQSLVIEGSKSLSGKMNQRCIFSDSQNSASQSDKKIQEILAWAKDDTLSGKKSAPREA